jgi:hypothetical protein
MPIGKDDLFATLHLSNLLGLGKHANRLSDVVLDTRPYVFLFFVKLLKCSVVPFLPCHPQQEPQKYVHALLSMGFTNNEFL